MAFKMDNRMSQILLYIVNPCTREHLLPHSLPSGTKKYDHDDLRKSPIPT